MARSLKILPYNYLGDWGEFEAWAEGASSSPSGWIKGSTPGVLQESTQIKFGNYSARLIGSSAIAGIYRTIPNGTEYQGRTFSLGAWGKSASTGPYIEINDGVSSKTYHLDGTNAFTFRTTAPFKLDKANTQFTIGLWASANATAYYDGVVLCEGENLFTDLADGNILVANWEPVLNLRSDDFETSNKDGSIVPDVRRRARPIRIKGTIAGSDVNSTRTHFDNFMRSMLSWKTDEQRTIYLFDDRCADVYLQNVNHDFVRGANMVNYVASVINPDASERYIAKLRSRTVITATIQEFNLTYNGTADTLPFFQFAANQGSTITTCRLENMTTGENLAYTGTVPSGAALDIDMLEGTIFNNGVNSISQYGTSDFIRLVRGVNYFRYVGTQCTILCDYFERYL